MTARSIALVLIALTYAGHLSATEPAADSLEPPAERIEMVLGSDI